MGGRSLFAADADAIPEPIIAPVSALADLKNFLRFWRFVGIGLI